MAYLITLAYWFNLLILLLEQWIVLAVSCSIDCQVILSMLQLAA
jgi:hypothetical protein